MGKEDKPLTREQLNFLIETYLLQQRLKEVPFQRLYDTSKWFVKKPGFIEFDPIPRTFQLYDPVTRTIPQYFENDTIKVTHRDPLEIIEDEPVNNNDAVYTVPAGEYKKIVQIYADLDNIGGVSNFIMTIVKNIGGATLVDAMVTTAVALAAGQDGSIFLAPNGPAWFNDNGAITNQDENIVGSILGPGDTITVTWDNKDADDRARLQVIAIDQPNMAIL